MIGSYGIAKIDTDPVTDANVQFLRDTDLGINRTQTTSQNVIPAKGEIATITTVVTGSGFDLTPGGGPKDGILCSATGGSGSGATFMVQSVASAGIMIAGSSVKNTAGFNEMQNNLAKNLKFDDSATALAPYTYARVTSSADPFTGVSTAIAGTSATGTAGTFIVTVTGGSVTGVTVSASGTLYKVGDVVTITEATLEAGAAFGGGNVFQGDLTLLLTEENVTGGINTVVDTITVINGGSGYTAADTLTLQQIGSSNTGSATLDVVTLSGALNTPGPIKEYPSAILNTGATAGAIQVIDSVGNSVILGGMQPGVIRPFVFSQVLGAGTGPAIGEITIFYN